LAAFPQPSDVAAELARRDLHHFVRLLWPVVVPGDAFVDGFHIGAACTALEAVTDGSVKRLLINVPPRHAKSLLSCVFLPAWVWLSRPEARFLAVSYGLELAVEDSRLCRMLVESSEYQRLTRGGLLLAADQNEKTRFANERRGIRAATSIGGAVTGFGADIIIVDDPHKAEDATSPGKLQAAKAWYDGTLSTRLNDPETGAIIVVCQRIHENDLSGHLLERGDWQHLCLPAEFEVDHPYRSPADPRNEEGALLWPQRFSAATIADLKHTLGTYGAASQLQQRPAPAGGGIFKTEWFRYYDVQQPPTNFDDFVQSWDLAFGGGPTADYVVGQFWGHLGAHSYLLWQTRQRLDFPGTLTAIREMTERAAQQYPPARGHAILIEDAANAHATVDVLKHEIPGVILVPPEGSKAARAHAVSPQVEAGNVWLPGKASADGQTFDRASTPQWVQEFVTEAASFPNAKHDDQVDAMSQALRRLGRAGSRIWLLGF
jgi:predicted phage terminase large subunit-like protein